MFDAIVAPNVADSSISPALNSAELPLVSAGPAYFCLLIVLACSMIELLLSWLILVFCLLQALPSRQTLLILQIGLLNDIVAPTLLDYSTSLAPGSVCGLGCIGLISNGALLVTWSILVFRLLRTLLVALPGLL